MSGRGFAVVETTDGKALYAWVAEWAHLLPLETTPCLEDADAGAVVKMLEAVTSRALVTPRREPQSEPGTG